MSTQVNDFKIAEELRISCLPNYQRLETVLVIEDSPELNKSLSLRIQREGYNVISALDGASGLEEAERVDPDLIILDLGLPRLNGMHVLKELKAAQGPSGTPIIVLTGMTDPKVEARARAFGVNRFMRKPIRQKSITQAVWEVLNGL